MFCHPKKLLAFIALFLAPFAINAQDFPVNPAAKMLPERLGEFRSAARIEGVKEGLIDQNYRRNITSWASRPYVSKDGQRFSVALLTANSDSAAYAAMARIRHMISRTPGEPEVTTADVGTEGFSFGDGKTNELKFFKGRVFVSVSDESQDRGGMLNFGRVLAETLDKGEGETPVLLKHLPGWPSVQGRALYILHQEELKNEFGNHRVLDVVSFDGGTEAAIADYDGSKLVLIEFKTPQLATDNDTRIATKIQELRNQGQPLPAAYRRVGNYLAFVFGASNEQAANQLIDQVQYQQVVQWLGRNPNIYDRAVNEFSRTTLGVFIAVVKASGLVIIGSLALGGLLGAVLFRIRRKQQQLAQAYSDAGGMLRLNIDELNATHDPARLIGRGN